MDNRLGLIPIDLPELRKALDLPDTTEILGVILDRSRNPERIYLRVSSPDFPEAPSDGSKIPIVQPCYISEQIKCGKNSEIVITRFERWHSLGW